MAKKPRTINACEVRLGILKDRQTIGIRWDKDKFDSVINSVYAKPLENKVKRKRSQWVMFLDELNSDDAYYWGHFSYARYGSKSYQLIDGERLTLRQNPREIEEGERAFTHFLIRKSDGFMLLETGLFDVVTRPKIMEYFDTFGDVASHGVEYTVVNPLLGLEFFEEISKLNSIKSAHVELFTEKATGLNPAFQAMRDTVEEIEAYSFQVSVKAKRRNSLSYRKIKGWIESVIRSQGVRAIRVAGNVGTMHKIINLDKNAEKYRPDVEFDDLGQVTSESIYDEMKKIAQERLPLPNEEVTSNRKVTSDVDDDE